jgi:hypothetical protein
MKPRRALTATAAAAVLVPLGLIAAPAVQASGGEGGDGSPVPSATASVFPSATATAAPSGPAQSPPETSAPAATTTPTTKSPASPDAPGADGSPSASSSPSSSHSPSPSPTDVTATPSAPRPSGSPSPSAGESRGPGDTDGVCDVADFDVRVFGLPATLAAGTTTEAFTVVLDNTAGGDAARVQFGFAVAFRDGLQDADWTAAQRYMSVHYYDWDDETWRSASTDGGVYTYADIEAGKRYEMRLRLVLAPDTPPGAAGALAFSSRWDLGRTPGTGACEYDYQWYRFEITSSGIQRDAAEARPHSGRTPVVLRAEARQNSAGAAPLEGALARTGSAPQLPVALASIAALALGVAALRFATRRRN